MSQIEQDKFDKVIKVVGNKGNRWLTGRAYQMSIPLGFEVKNEPHELVVIAKKLFEENKQLKLKIQQLESSEHVK